jgi:hypothetical protein
MRTLVINDCCKLDYELLQNKRKVQKALLNDNY